MNLQLQHDVRFGFCHRNPLTVVVVVVQAFGDDIFNLLGGFDAAEIVPQNDLQIALGFGNRATGDRAATQHRRSVTRTAPAAQSRQDRAVGDGVFVTFEIALASHRLFFCQSCLQQPAAFQTGRFAVGWQHHADVKPLSFPHHRGQVGGDHHQSRVARRQNATGITDLATDHVIQQLLAKVRRRRIAARAIQPHHQTHATQGNHVVARDTDVITQQRSLQACVEIVVVFFGDQPRTFLADHFLQFGAKLTRRRQIQQTGRTAARQQTDKAHTQNCSGGRSTVANLRSWPLCEGIVHLETTGLSGCRADPEGTAETTEDWRERRWGPKSGRGRHSTERGHGAKRKERLETIKFRHDGNNTVPGFPHECRPTTFPRQLPFGT